MLATFRPTEYTELFRAMAATASSNLSCATPSLLDPQTVLLKACKEADQSMNQRTLLS